MQTQPPASYSLPVLPSSSGLASDADEVKMNCMCCENGEKQPDKECGHNCSPWFLVAASFPLFGGLFSMWFVDLFSDLVADPEIVIVTYVLFVLYSLLLMFAIWGLQLAALPAFGTYKQRGDKHGFLSYAAPRIHFYSISAFYTQPVAAFIPLYLGGVHVGWCCLIAVLIASGDLLFALAASGGRRGVARAMKYRYLLATVYLTPLILPIIGLIAVGFKADTINIIVPKEAFRSTTFYHVFWLMLTIILRMFLVMGPLFGLMNYLHKHRASEKVGEDINVHVNDDALTALDNDEDAVVGVNGVAVVPVPREDTKEREKREEQEEQEANQTEHRFALGLIKVFLNIVSFANIGTLCFLMLGVAIVQRGGKLWM